jgi:hypothetical protein
MTPVYHLPPERRRAQEFVAQFNADERLWRRLESKRRLRRRLYPRMSAKLRKQLDLLEFAAARPPQDCVGRFSSLSFRPFENSQKVKVSLDRRAGLALDR